MKPIVLALALLSATACENEWAKHHCRPTGRTDTIFMLMYVGKIPILTPIITSEGACDDGLIRWR